MIIVTEKVIALPGFKCDTCAVLKRTQQKEEMSGHHVVCKGKQVTMMINKIAIVGKETVRRRSRWEREDMF